MRKASNSMVDGVRQLTYTVKSLGKKHPYQTIEQIAHLSVDDIYELEPSHVSDNIRYALNNPDNKKILGAEKMEAVIDLFRLKKMLPKKSETEKSATRQIMLTARTNRHKTKKSMKKQVNDMVSTAQRMEWLRKNLPEAPTATITPRRRGGRKTSRRKKTKRRRKGSIK